MKSTKKGLYGKFIVTRTDGGSDTGGKHDGCEYFVLDLTHDPFAAVALAAYSEACRDEYPILASDLRNSLARMALDRAAVNLSGSRENR